MKSKSSLKSRMICRSLKSIRFSERTFARLLKNPKRNRRAFQSHKKSLQSDRIFIQGFEMMTLRNTQSRNKHIVFFHGGAYVAEPGKFMPFPLCRFESSKPAVIFLYFKGLDDSNLCKDNGKHYPKFELIEKWVAAS